MKESHISIRLLVFFVLWIISYGAFYSLIFIIYPNALTSSSDYFEKLMTTDYFFLILTQVAAFCGTVVSVMFSYKFIEEKKDEIIPRRYKLRPLLSGMLIGAMVISVVVVALLITQSVRLHYQTISPELGYYVLAFALVAYTEELLSRGYIFRILLDKNKYIALSISSAVFALLHSFNSSLTPLSYLNLFLSGLLFCYAYLLTNMNLSAPIGIHFAWNFLQGPVFGFAVSGFSTKSIFRVEVLNQSLSGGDFGLEGSVILTAVLLLVVIFAYVLDRRNIRRI